MKHRQEEEGVVTEKPKAAENPFEKKTETTAPLKVEGEEPQDANTNPTAFKPKPKVQSSPSGRFKFWIMTISLVLLTLLFVLYNSLVSKAYRGFLNENFLKMIHRNEGRIVSIPYLLLYIMYFVSAATFLYLVSEYFGWTFYKEPVQQYLLCFTAVGLIFLVKHLALLLISMVFPIEKVVRQYSFTIIIFNIVLGICLIPFNLFIAFTAPALAKGLIYIAIVLITILYIYRSFRGLLIAGSFLSFHKFHFFMYLCTVEIAPVILLLAIFNSTGVAQ
ncbi:MAG: DUF4271 domain-containing protein [Saprospiraceae bacterium]